METRFPYDNYYTFNGELFSTKLNALIAIGQQLVDNKDKKWLTWSLPSFEDEIKKHNLFLEPTESLQTLYKQRAEQLRNKYNYLILYYSGGNDSHNILETFLKNNIFLDEIVILNWYDTATKKQWEIEHPDYIWASCEGYEAEHLALPLAKSLVEKYSPHTKITYVENVFEKNKSMYESFEKGSINLNLKSHVEVLLDFRNILRLREHHRIDKRFGDLKAAHIHGICKPCVNRDSNGYYLLYQDNIINGRCDPVFQKDSCAVNELFYMHPSTIKMQIKQAHALINNAATDFDIERTREGEDRMAEILYGKRNFVPYKGKKYLDLLKTERFKKLMSHINPNSNIHSFEFTVMQQIARDVSSKAKSNVEMLSDFIHNEFFIKFGISKQQTISWLVKTSVTKKFYLKWI